jgi:hypothetical protein
MRPVMRDAVEYLRSFLDEYESYRKIAEAEVDLGDLERWHEALTARHESLMTRLAKAKDLVQRAGLPPNNVTIASPDTAASAVNFPANAAQAQQVRSTLLEAIGAYEQRLVEPDTETPFVRRESPARVGWWRVIPRRGVLVAAVGVLASVAAVFGVVFSRTDRWQDEQVIISVAREVAFTEDVGGPLVPTKVRLAFRNTGREATTLSDLVLYGDHSDTLGGHRYREAARLPLRLAGRDEVIVQFELAPEDEARVARIVATDLDGNKYEVTWPYPRPSGAETSAGRAEVHDSVIDSVQREDGRVE